MLSFVSRSDSLDPMMARVSRILSSLVFTSLMASRQVHGRQPSWFGSLVIGWLDESLFLRVVLVLFGSVDSAIAATGGRSGGRNNKYDQFDRALVE